MLDRCYLAKDMPTLLVWGDRDGVIPVTHAYQVHAALPESRLEVFANAGHSPHQNQPARFLQAFREFYDSTSPCSHSAEAWRALGEALPRHELEPTKLVELRDQVSHLFARASVASKELIVGPVQGRVAVEQRGIPGQADGLLKLRRQDEDTTRGGRRRNEQNLGHAFTSYLPETIQKPLLAPNTRGVL